MKYKTLNNGVNMPIIGFGVYQIWDLQQCENSVIQAIKNGYRMIDTALVYKNEIAVGNGIKKSKIDRKDIFITTKVWYGPDGYNTTKETIKNSIKNLQTDYIDLVLIHQPYGDYYGSWKALEELYNQKVIRAIGVSNFSPERLVDLCMNSKIRPMVNQIEMHPFFQRDNEIEWAKKYNVAIESWASFAECKNDIFNNSTLLEIAKKHNKTTAQVILRWLTQKDVIVIPKTVTESRMIENISIFDFELSESEMEAIKKLDTNKTLFFDHASPEACEYLSSFKPE